MFKSRVQKQADKVRDWYDGLTEAEREELRSQTDLSQEEHESYAQAVTRAVAMGYFGTRDVRTIFHALGKSWSPSNGGWAPDTDDAMKVAMLALFRNL